MTNTDVPKLSLVGSREPDSKPAKTFEDAPITRLERISYALACARTARNWLRLAGADKAADYQARAIKSIEGAERHEKRLERDTDA
jgi:hypothetical protein